MVDAVAEGADPSDVVVGQQLSAGVDLAGIGHDRDGHEVLGGLVAQHGVDEVFRRDLEVGQAVVRVHRVRQVEHKGDLDVLHGFLRLAAGRRGHLVDADHAHEDRRHHGEGVGSHFARTVAFDNAHGLEVFRDSCLLEVVSYDLFGVERLLEVCGS
jgi:hypothetical protein